jgi:AGZA family xanthine/uracil permease-like MFS transporter
MHPPSLMTAADRSPRWFTIGDINAFFGLMLDNVVNLAVLSGILVGGFGFPSDIVFTRMFPGTALGVLLGNLVYTAMAIRLGRRTGRADVTAMPLGTDTPSTIGIALAVLGPAFLAAKATMPEREAAILAWQVGMATMVLMGIFKVAMSFVGGHIGKWIPAAGLLGSIGGVGVALLGALQLGEIYAEPVVGMVALGLILYALVARIRLPFQAPGVLVAVTIGVILYYGLGAWGLTVHPVVVPEASMLFALPIPTMGFLTGMPIAIREYLPLALPFAILTIVGGINVTESARLAGDDYRTRDILLTEALSTLVAGICGGVSQTTPYIGHPAYKAMGGRAGYTLLTGLFIGLGGIFGYVGFMAALLPRPALAPVLFFIGLEITSQAYAATPRRHMAAVTVAILPSIAVVVQILLSQVYDGALMSAAIDPEGTMQATGLTNPAFIQTVGVMIMLASGFIVTAMLWGAAVAFLTDRLMMRASLTLLACAVLAFFGFIHSVLPGGGVYLPWTVASDLPYHWSAAYLALAAVLLVVSRSEAAGSRHQTGASGIGHRVSGTD